MKRSTGWLAVLLLCLSALAHGQYTTVTGTVVDPIGIPYGYGTVLPMLVISAAGTPQITSLNNANYTPPAQPSGLDINGHFVVNVATNATLIPAGSHWNFLVCSSFGALQHAVGRAGVCFQLASAITISGATQDISTQLNAVALPLTYLTSGITLQTSGVNNPSQILLNLIAGTGISLTTTSSGTTIATTGGSGITGSGTVPTIPVFTGTSVIGNSMLTDDGTNLIYNGADTQFPGNVSQSTVFSNLSSGVQITSISGAPINIGPGGGGTFATNNIANISTSKVAWYESRCTFSDLSVAPHANGGLSNVGANAYCTDVKGPQDGVLVGSIAVGSGTGAHVIYDGTNWRTQSGDRVNIVDGVTVSGTPSAGQALVATSASAAAWSGSFAGTTKDFSVSGCTTAASTDSSCTGTITISPAFSDASYIPVLTVNSINGAYLYASVSGSLVAGSFPYTLTCTFNCSSIVTPTIYVHAFHP